VALLNLVRNATDASPAGGTVRVSTRRGTEAGFVEIGVADEGDGMSADVVSRAAEPFFTTKAHGKGTGLGLSMVAGFCQQSGGAMRIESDRGCGTVVRLVLPEAVWV
jgi:signal transduction histidine kinase